jgi:hypothetical protein
MKYSQQSSSTAFHLTPQLMRVWKKQFRPWKYELFIVNHNRQKDHKITTITCPQHDAKLMKKKSQTVIIKEILGKHKWELFFGKLEKS